MTMTTYHIPPLVKISIDNYVEERYHPGGFVTSVLENDLKGALGTADEHSLRSLKDIVMYCMWEIPAYCWGSPEIVRAWLTQTDEETSS